MIKITPMIKIKPMATRMIKSEDNGELPEVEFDTEGKFTVDGLLELGACAMASGVSVGGRTRVGLIVVPVAPEPDDVVGQRLSKPISLKSWIHPRALEARLDVPILTPDSTE